MISFVEAQNICLEEANSICLPVEKISIHCSIGRVVSSSVFSPLDLQPFDNSAMDGYAVNHKDIEFANENTPVFLNNVGVVPAGDRGTKFLEKGNCIKIMTGAPIPLGATAVVPIEFVLQESNKIKFSRAIGEKDNIRFKGEDFHKNDLIIAQGHRIREQDILTLTSLGISSIEVFCKPRIVFLTTGNEVITNLTQPLERGQIYNSNLYYGTSFLGSIGANVIHTECLRDDKNNFIKKIKDILEMKPDIIVSSGAVSAGDFDFIKEGIKEIGGEVFFHKIKMKPGKPNLFAKINNKVLYFGLPGNPVATAVGLRFLITPVVQQILKQPKENPQIAILENSFRKNKDLQMFLKSSYKINEEAQSTAQVLDGQESFKVKPFINMKGWVVAPEGLENLEKGDRVDFFPVLPN